MMRVRVGQLGSRMYYGIPRALASLGALEKLYTDFTVSKGFPALMSKFPPFTSMNNRKVPGISADQIVHLPDYGWMNKLRTRYAKTEHAVNALNFKMGTDLEALIMKDKLEGVDAITMVGSSSQHVFKLARDKGIKTISEQIIAPSATYQKIMLKFLPGYEGWEEIKTTEESMVFWQEISYREWKQTDFLLCGSEFVKDAVISLGFDGEKTIVIPYGVPTTLVNSPQKEYSGDRKLKLLFVGTVCLRKGIQYLLEIAHELSAYCEIRICGNILLKSEIIDRYKDVVTFEGHIASNDLASYYEWADVFVLPTLFEGSATVCYEAIQHKLPIITTGNSGIFLKHEEGILLVSPGSSEKSKRAILKFYENPELVREFSSHIEQRITFASLDAYMVRIQDFFRKLWSLWVD